MLKTFIFGLPNPATRFWAKYVHTPCCTITCAVVWGAAAIVQIRKPTQWWRIAQSYKTSVWVSLLILFDVILVKHWRTWYILNNQVITLHALTYLIQTIHPRSRNYYQYHLHFALRDPGSELLSDRVNSNYLAPEPGILVLRLSPLYSVTLSSNFCLMPQCRLFPYVKYSQVSVSRL